MEQVCLFPDVQNTQLLRLLPYERNPQTKALIAEMVRIVSMEGKQTNKQAKQKANEILKLY